jgi:PTH2 family peptidyl-tRNA hydrolase
MEYKLVVVVRSDLELSRGKLAVQVAHAAVSCALEAKARRSRWFGPWIREGQRKVAVRAKDLAELLGLKREAERRGLLTSLVSDAGLTEVPPGTTTCLGIGPGPEGLLDEVTGHLKLL